jgi:16S rRNA (guanine527-N7)-methyltransferase
MIADEASARSFVAGLDIEAAALARIDRLVDLLRAENGRQNLVSSASLDSVWQRHIADSAQLLCHVPRGTLSWLDLGTGAGFPGLVIAALRPDWAVTMVESRGRRIEWLNSAVAALDLPQARIIGARLEQVPAFPADVISARAFAPLPRLLSLSARFSTSATQWLLPKGRSAAQELAELTGWRHMFHVERSLTDCEAGIIIGRLEPQPGRKP